MLCGFDCFHLQVYVLPLHFQLLETVEQFGLLLGDRKSSVRSSFERPNGGPEQSGDGHLAKLDDGCGKLKKVRVLA